ncbi:hypothetical protein MLD38_012190 [Melastoma candidum]|uniref:Uncharacterized protein n=1 Tax=Melastoma candidum TaxID=119954 RepID=A0ACB9R646_9MYRT|nr:hypothetical protein MLD38_012190 [Melastoma candidum]
MIILLSKTKENKLPEFVWEENKIGRREEVSDIQGSIKAAEALEPRRKGESTQAATANVLSEKQQAFFPYYHHQPPINSPNIKNFKRQIFHPKMISVRGEKTHR